MLLVLLCSGLGVHPRSDHNGHPFSDKKRAAKAGLPIASGYLGILDGFEGDQDFMRVAFQLTRYLLSSQFQATANSEHPICILLC